METERSEGPAPVATTARVVLLVVGAGLLILGSFLDWRGLGEVETQLEAVGGELPGTAGVNLAFSVFYSTDPGQASFLGSAGLVTIVIGVLALLGILIPWLARLAGALAIIAFVLFVVQLYRAPAEGQVDFTIGNVGLGMWLVLVGGVLALIAGFLSARRTVVTTTTAPPPREP